MFKPISIIMSLLVLTLWAQSAQAAKKLLGSSGPVDRPVNWGSDFLNSEHIGGSMVFVAPGTDVTVEFVSQGSPRIDGVLLDGPGGLDGPDSETDNRWYEIYVSGHLFLDFGFPVPNPEFANFGPDEFYLNFPDSAATAGWTNVIWSGLSAPDSMGTDGWPTSYTGSIRVGEAASGEKVSSLRLENLVPGSSYKLTYWSKFNRPVLGIDYEWSVPPSSAQASALELTDHYNLWVNIYADDGLTPDVVEEILQLAGSDSGCPLPFRDDSSRFFFQDDWLIVRGESDPMVPGSCLNNDLKVWRREGEALVPKADIPVPSSAAGQQFGTGLAIDGDQLVVGSSLADASDPAGGTVFVFQLEDEGWTLVQEITPPASLLSNRGGFGHSVVVKDGLMGVWADVSQELLVYELNSGVWEYSDSIGDMVDHHLNPDPVESMGDILQLYSGSDGVEFVVSSREEYLFYMPPEIGAVKIITRDGVMLEFATVLNPMDDSPPEHWTEDHFSHAMDASALRQVFGIPNNDEAGPDAGAVWVRHRDSVAEPWTTTFLFPPRPVVRTVFGSAVAIEGDVLLVGAPGALSDSGETGACYRFALEDDQWVPAGELKPTDIMPGDGFGTALSLDSGYAVLSSPGKNSGAGALYLFSVAHDASAVEEPPMPMPMQLKISSIFPNPFNPSILIRFAVPQPGMTSLRIHDLQGRLVKTLISESLAAGIHEFYWHGENDMSEAVPSGIYFLRVVSGGRAASTKITLLK